jgi:hypothetical protein
MNPHCRTDAVMRIVMNQLVAAQPSEDVDLATILDPSDLGPLHVAPLVPIEILQKHKVDVPTDQRFRAAARLLQALWREDRGLVIGHYLNGQGKRVRLGSRITPVAGRQGENFLSPDIATLVRRECLFREIGALLEVDRLQTNLLSSMPMTFNLFAPLKVNLRNAARFIDELFPGFMAECKAVRFEHSPGRGDPRYTADHSAFDVCLYGLSATGDRVFVAFEIKYSETGFEPIPERFSPRHFAIAEQAGLLLETEDPTIALNPVQQLHREHCLAQSILDNDKADAGIFVLLAPSLNHLVQDMGVTYARKLAPSAAGKVRFETVTLERSIHALASIGLITHAQKLFGRYADFRRIEGELDLEFENQRAAAD